MLTTKLFNRASSLHDVGTKRAFTKLDHAHVLWKILKAVDI